MDHEECNAVRCDQQEMLKPGQQCATKPLKLMNVNKNISLLQSVQDPMLTLNQAEPQGSSFVSVPYLCMHQVREARRHTVQINVSKKHFHPCICVIEHRSVGAVSHVTARPLHLTCRPLYVTAQSTVCLTLRVLIAQSVVEII